MKSKGMIVSLLMMSLLGSCANTSNRCGTKEACREDAKCKCWCSQGCGFRSKLPEDHPKYIENDPNGKFCYCKQWDVDYYQDNCIKHMKVKQEKGAK